MYSLCLKYLKEIIPKDIGYNYKNILILMSPIIPHFASECLEIIGIKEKVIWPVYDKKLIQEEEINIVVQINGKKREILRSQINTSEENLLKLIMTNDKLNKYLNNKTIKKKIYIKDKLINIIL